MFVDFREINQSHQQLLFLTSLILRQLTRRVGTLAPEVRSQIEALALPQLEALGDALLDFTDVTDLLTWLQTQQTS